MGVTTLATEDKGILVLSQAQKSAKRRDSDRSLSICNISFASQDLSFALPRPTLPFPHRTKVIDLKRTCFRKVVFQEYRNNYF